MKILWSLLFAMLPLSILSAAETFVVSSQQQDALPVNGSEIVFSDTEYDGVKIAIDNLKNDMTAVFGSSVAAATPTKIIIGTVGRNADIDRMVKQGVLKDLKGKREKFIITTVDGKVVIAGSDRRGTIYGVYELSRQLGVSPWYWWADAPINHLDEAYIIKGVFTDGEPAVEFRGLFLNDEAPCLTSWVKNTFGTNYGDHRFYEKVFELILRLKGNMLWPAMWGWAFYADDPENLKTADRMGIIMGTSHHEPMARNHQEYARKRREWGAWNYQTNQENLDRFFREGIERMKDTEDMVTIGMRGDGDEAMSAEADTKLLEKIVKNQRKIIADVTGKPANKTTQVWALYKEVLDYYDAGMRVPDDVIMLLCDDNWGNVRRVPNEKERKHPGGWGLYYHVDYVGAPRNSKWLNVTQTQQMFEQLSLAYDFGIQRMWILNVGDLKPMEYPIQLFLDMAWNPKEYTQQNIINHTQRFFDENLSANDSSLPTEIASIYNENCKYMARVTPEMLDARTYNLETSEWQKVVSDYKQLELRALRLFSELPESSRDFYRQTLLFPVQAMSNLYEMYYAQAMNLSLADRNLPEANEWADKVAECFRRDSLLCLHYNKVMSNGKWDGFMTQKHIGYRSWNDNFRRDTMPRVKTVGTKNDNSDDKSSASTGGYVFSPSDGYVSMEAEHFFSSTNSEGTQWSVYPDYGRTLSAVALTPYTKPTGDAALHYRFSLPKDAPREVKVHVVVKSTLDFLNHGGMEYQVSIDGSKAETVNFNSKLVDRQPYMYSVFYPTVASRVVESTVTLNVADGDEHTLTIHPCHPGIVFEKIVVDFGGYKKQHLFGAESPVTRTQK